MAITLDGTTGINLPANSLDVGDLQSSSTAGQVITSGGTGVAPTWADASGGGFTPVSVSGATQALDVGSYNFFNAGDLTVDTTVSFTSVPTDALWTYTAKAAILENYSIQAAVYTKKSFSVSGQELTPTGLAFSSDGTKMFVTGNTGNDVGGYTLTTAWDISTAYFTTDFPIAEDSAPEDVAFSPDGTKMYIVGGLNDSVFQYTLGTAWDLSTATYASLSVSVAAQEIQPSGLAFSSDGTKMYICGLANDTVYQYTLGTAWNVSTATYASLSISVAAQDLAPQGITFNSDGTKMFIVGHDTDSVYQYTLSTAWNVSTATYDSVSFSVAAQDLNPEGVVFNPDGLRMYIVGSGSDNVYEYYTALISTITVPAAVQNPPATLFYNSNQVTYTFVTNDGGTTVKLIGEEIT